MPKLRKAKPKPAPPRLPDPVGVNEGKKDIPWDEDVEILNRLASVAGMLVQGAAAHQIATSFDYSLRTAYRDISRVKELWMRSAQTSVDENRQASIAQYRYIQAEAWEHYRKTDRKDGAERARWLKVAMEAEDRITELQGTKRKLLDVTSAGQRLGFAKELTDDELAAIAAGSGPGTADPATGAPEAD